MIDFEGCRNRFVIQKHDAKRAGLHYDLRIEGKRKGKCVLYSWVTRKLDDLLSGDVNKIALYQTDDHELTWLSFEGEVEAGYGEGVVEIYDKGTFEVVGVKPTNVVLRFKGNKLKGLYAIVKTGTYFLLVRVKNTSEANVTTDFLPYATFRQTPRRRRIRFVATYPILLLGGNTR